VFQVHENNKSCGVTSVHSIQPPIRKRLNATSIAGIFQTSLNTSDTPEQPASATEASPEASQPHFGPSVTPNGALLSKDQARKLLRRDVSNLVKKVASGKLLSATERALVQSAADGSDLAAVKTWASDQVGLAEAPGGTRKAISRWRKEGAPDPKADGRWSVTEWKAWMATNGKSPTTTAEEDKQPPRQQLEAKRLLLMNEKLEIEIGVLRGEFTKNGDIERHIRDLVTEARKVGESMPASLAPQVAGLPVPELEKRLRAWWDEYGLALHIGIPIAVRGSETVS
jgi:hypothetical protein